VPRPSSSTTDFGQSIKVIGVKKAQISYDAPLPSKQGQAQPGVPAQNSPGNHSKNFANAQITNDLYGIPMINPLKISTSSSGGMQSPETPLTTIIPQPIN